MDISSKPWPDIYNIMVGNGKKLKCTVNGTVGFLSVKSEMIEQGPFGVIEVWVFKFNGNELIRVSGEFSGNEVPKTSGITINIAEAH